MGAQQGHTMDVDEEAAGPPPSPSPPAADETATPPRPPAPSPSIDPPSHSGAPKFNIPHYGSALAHYMQQPEVVDAFFTDTPAGTSFTAWSMVRTAVPWVPHGMARPQSKLGCVRIVQVQPAMLWLRGRPRALTSAPLEWDGRAAGCTMLVHPWLRGPRALARAHAMRAWIAQEALRTYDALSAEEKAPFVAAAAEEKAAFMAKLAEHVRALAPGNSDA